MRTGRGAVTAVIVGYNSARHLAGLRASLLGGTLVPSRLLLVDNASGDETPSRSRELGIELWARATNDGFGAACNEGLRIAETEYVLFCNPDVRPAPDALEKLCGALEEEPGAALAGASCAVDPAPRRFSTLGQSLSGFLPAALHELLRRDSRASAGRREHGVIPVDYAEGALLLGRVEALRAVGGFDERFFLYHEEEDLSRRLRARGWATLLVQQARAAHAGGRSSDGVGSGALSAFRLHSQYWYHRRYSSRAYAEVARATLALAVAADRGYRRIMGRPQIYGPGAALSAFRSVSALRRAHGLGQAGTGR